MTKTEAMIGNLKLKECDSILEFLFGDTDNAALPGGTKEKAASREHNAKLKVRANISHEIKNPLNCIISYAELLCKNSASLQEELKRYVENIRISSLQLKSLLLDVIENAKFEYGKSVAKKQKIETGRAIKDVLCVFEKKFGEKNIKVHSALIQANIISDGTKFNQILYNLIGNSAKYTNQNGEIHVVSWVYDDEFYFEIKNTGSLINKNDAKKIFKFLHTAGQKGASSKDEESYGIGLCVSKQLAEVLNGGLEFENAGKEAIFRFHIPLK